MLKKLTLLAIFIGAFSTANVHAADNQQAAQTQTHATAEIPIFAQKIRFQLPLTWKHAFTNNSENNFLIEFIPKNEDIKKWKNLFSIQGFKQVDRNLTPELLADRVAQNFGRSCSQATVYAKLGNINVDGYPAFQAIIGCANMPSDSPLLKKGQSEISFFTFIQGKENMYFIQKAYRANGFANEGIPADVQQAMATMQNFLPVQLCAITSPKGKCEK